MSSLNSSTLTSSPYNPTYIILQDPNRFGGKQADYLQRANQVIEKAAAKIRKAKHEGGDLIKLFYEIIADFSLERGQIAQDHRTKDAHNFGKRRDVWKIDGLSYLNMSGVYQEYGERILTKLHDWVKSMEIKSQPGTFKKMRTIDEVWLDRRFRIEIEVFEGKDLLERDWTGPLQHPLPDYLQQVVAEAGEAPSDDEYAPEILKKLGDASKKFKKEQPEQYQNGKMRGALQTFVEYYPSPEQGGKEEHRKSIWIRATLRVEIKGKLYALTRYLSWMYRDAYWVQFRDPSHHPLEKMKRDSHVMLIMQDALLVEETLQEIAEIFAATLKAENKPALKDQMALLMHIASHNMRDSRGTASEDEWLEAAIYKGLDVPFSKNTTMVDLESLANPFYSEFRKAYDRIVTFHN